MTNRTIVSIELGGTNANNAVDAATNLGLGPNSSVTFGNVSVQGSITQGGLIAANVTIQDPIILLANSQSGSPAIDIGFIGRRGSSDNVAFIWKESAKEFVAVYTANTGTVDIVQPTQYANLRVDWLAANNIVGNLAGNLVQIIADSGTIPLSASDELNVLGDPQSLRTVATGNTITISLTDDVTVPGSLTVVGDLHVFGNSTVVSSNNLVVEDNILTLANNAIVSFAIDSGLVLIRGNNVANAAMIWQSANNRFLFGRTTANGISSNANIEISDYANVALGNLSFATGTGAIYGSNNMIVGLYVDGVDVASANASIQAIRLNTNHFVGTTLATHHNANFVVGNGFYIGYNNGFTGIGTTTPSEVLDVAGNVKVQSNLIVGNTIYLGSAGPYEIDGAIAKVAGTPSVYYSGSWYSLITATTANVEASLSTAGRATLYDSTNSIAGSTFVIFDESNTRMGVGTTSFADLDAKLHVRTGSAGAVVPSADADEFAIEGAQNVGLSILTQTDKIGSVNFASLNGNTRGGFTYNHATNVFSINSSGATRVFIANTGNVGIGTSSPTNLLHVYGNVSANYFVGNGALLTGIVSAPGGSDTYVQFNDGGVFGGNVKLTFNKANGTLNVQANVAAMRFYGDGGMLTNTAKGANGTVQFNWGGEQTGDSNLIFNKDLNTLYATGSVNFGGGALIYDTSTPRFSVTLPIVDNSSTASLFTFNSNSSQFLTIRNINAGSSATSVLNILTTTATMQNYVTGTAGVIGMATNSPIYFHTNGIFRGVISASGFWNIGSSDTPVANLTVVGNTYTTTNSAIGHSESIGTGERLANLTIGGGGLVGSDSWNAVINIPTTGAGNYPSIVFDRQAADRYSAIVWTNNNFNTTGQNVSSVISSQTGNVFIYTNKTPGTNTAGIVAAFTGDRRVALGSNFYTPNTTLEVYGATSVLPAILTDNTTVIVNILASNFYHLTLGGNRTLQIPATIVPGQSGVFVIKQGAAGSNTLAFHANYLFPGGTDPTLSTTANAVDLIPFYTLNTSHVLMGTINKGFA